MFLNLLRWLKGYVTFSAKGKFPERFINLMNINGVRYWDSEPSRKGFVASMSAKDYKYIRYTVKNTGVKLKLIDKKGLPFIIHRYRKRKGIPVGIICGILIITYLSQFVWVVDINGEEKIGEQEIKPVLQRCGLYVGAYKKSIDNNLIERNTLLELPQLRWISVNMLNNAATVEIKEKDEKPDIIENFPCNLRACCDGVITKTNVKNGTSQVKVGSAVVKNQVLVNSVMTDGKDNVKYVHSQGEIFADVSYSRMFTVNSEMSYLVPENKHTEKTTLNFLWFDFPGNTSSSRSGYKTSVFETYRLKINDVTLPTGFLLEKNYYLSKKTDIRSGKKILINELALYELFNERNSVIKVRKVDFEKNSSKISLNVKYTVNKNIANEQKISIKP